MARTRRPKVKRMEFTHEEFNALLTLVHAGRKDEEIGGTGVERGKIGKIGKSGGQGGQGGQGAKDGNSQSNACACGGNIEQGPGDGGAAGGAAEVSHDPCK